jgi:hypothetical protein
MLGLGFSGRYMKDEVRDIPSLADLATRGWQQTHHHEHERQLGFRVQPWVWPFSSPGIVRSVIRPRRVQVLDDMGYSDRNVACTRLFVARWLLVNANPDEGRPAGAGTDPIWVWAPTRQASKRRTC